jgi:enoyl-CoA hydratase
VSAEVRVRVEGTLGRITLDRPKAINALTLDMVRAVDAALTGWEEDPAVALVLLDGAGERGFCAGGDIVALRDSALHDGGEAARGFWAEEYRLDARIARYPKPVVSFLDGICMGGGVGLGGHVAHRVATERLVWSMPEVLIGFVPDVGGTWLLSRAPGALGEHLACTAGRVGAGDAVALGFADVVVPSQRLEELAGALRDGDAGAIAAFAVEPPEAGLLARRAELDAAYAGTDDAAQVAARLPGELDAGSPTAVQVALQAVRRARELPSLEACLEQELVTSCSVLELPDYVEGIRAAVVDKDRSPRWSPASLEEVAPADAARHLDGPRRLGLV